MMNIFPSTLSLVKSIETIETNRFNRPTIETNRFNYTQLSQGITEIHRKIELIINNQIESKI